MLTQSTLPETPPPLNQRIEFTDGQVQQIHSLLSRLSTALDSLPVVLSQDGDLITEVGSENDLIADRIAKLTGRVWNEGATRTARELIRFQEETIDDEEASSRANLMLYSIHVSGAVTLSVGWDISISLTQIRAEVADIKNDLFEIMQG